MILWTFLIVRMSSLSFVGINLCAYSNVQTCLYVCVPLSHCHIQWTNIFYVIVHKSNRYYPLWQWLSLIGSHNWMTWNARNASHGTLIADASCTPPIHPLPPTLLLSLSFSSVFHSYRFVAVTIIIKYARKHGINVDRTRVFVHVTQV